ASPERRISSIAASIIRIRGGMGMGRVVATAFFMLTLYRPVYILQPRIRTGSTPMNDANPSTKVMLSAAERQQRIDLAACYRLVAQFGWDDLIFTHISARIPGPEHHFLINPYGMSFDEISASSLVKVDLHGRKVGDSPYEINPAGFTIHSAIHAARDDAGCVLHVHSVNGIAVSAQEEGVLPLSQHSIFVLSSLAYHDYEGV